MRSRCRVRRDVLVKVKAAAAEAWPEEALGLLWADGSGEIVAATALANLHARPRVAARADAGRLASLERRGAASGMRLAGAYHSHVGAAATLSAQDRRQFCRFPVLWVLSVARHGVTQLAAFRRHTATGGIESLRITPSDRPA